MPRFVCLLRAIGPITHAKMSMAALRAACTGSGFGNVATMLATGNLLLDGDGTAAAVRTRVQALVDGFGIRSEVFIRTPRQLTRAVAANPFQDAAADHPSAFGVCFFHRAPERQDWLDSHTGPERLALVGSQLYIDYRSEIATSRLQVEKRFGRSMTMRNGIR